MAPSHSPWTEWPLITCLITINTMPCGYVLHPSLSLGFCPIPTHIGGTAGHGSHLTASPHSLHRQTALLYLFNIVNRLSAYASTQPHAYAYGGAAQLEVGSLPVSVSWPSALHCYLCLTHCSPGNVPNPTPGPLMSTPFVNTGQPTLY